MSDLPARRWAVTGATGLVGNNLVRKLLAQGAEVTVLVRGRNRRELAGLELRTVEGDLHDPAALAKAFEGAEAVVHAAADVRIGYARRVEMERTNVAGTAAVLAALPANARLIHVSTVDALGLGTWESPATEQTAPRPEEGGVPYVDTKRAADALVQQSDRDHVIVYPTMMYGPWDWKPSSGRMLLAVARGQGRFVPPGGNNFVHVGDVCQGIVRAVRAPRGSRYILGNENLRYYDAWITMASVTGGAKPIRILRPWFGRVVRGALSMKAWLGMGEGELNPAAIKMGFAPHYFDPALARRELELPATPVEQAFRDAWAWFQEHGYAGRR